MSGGLTRDVNLTLPDKKRGLYEATVFPYTHSGSNKERKKRGIVFLPSNERLSHVKVLLDVCFLTLGWSVLAAVKVKMGCL